MRYLSSSNADWYNSVNANDSFLHVNLCNGSAMALKLCTSLWKYCTKSKKDCTYLTVVGTGHSFKLHTFELLMCMPSSMISKLRNIVVLCKKLHFLSLQ